jgi:hypothetical protein
MWTLVATLSLLFAATTACVQCGSFFCPDKCGLTTVCNSGTPVRSPCCLPNRGLIPASQMVQRAPCGSSGQQHFTFSPSTGQFSIRTTSGASYCLEVFSGDYCDKAPTPLWFQECDASQVNQQWSQSGSQIFSGHLNDQHERTFCLSSVPNWDGSRASVQLAFENDVSQEWSFDWASNSGTLSDGATGECLQMPVELYGTTTTTQPPTVGPAPSLVGLALYRSTGTCDGTVVYMLLEVGRCDNLHGTGTSILVTSVGSSGYSLTTFSNYECNPPGNDVSQIPTGYCLIFSSFAFSLFSPKTSLPEIQMSGTYTQTQCSSPTNPEVTCASVLAPSYVLSQDGHAISWSDPPSTGTVFDRGLVVMTTTTTGSAYGSCLGWMDGLQLRLDCFPTSRATPRLECVYACSGACSTSMTTTTWTATLPPIDGCHCWAPGFSCQPCTGGYCCVIDWWIILIAVLAGVAVVIGIILCARRGCCPTCCKRKSKDHTYDALSQEDALKDHAAL